MRRIILFKRQAPVKSFREWIDLAQYCSKTLKLRPGKIETKLYEAQTVNIFYWFWCTKILKI